MYLGSSSIIVRKADGGTRSRNCQTALTLYEGAVRPVLRDEVKEWIWLLCSHAVGLPEDAWLAPTQLANPRFHGVVAFSDCSTSTSFLCPPNSRTLDPIFHHGKGTCDRRMFILLQHPRYFDRECETTGSYCSSGHWLDYLYTCTRS